MPIRYHLSPVLGVTHPSIRPNLPSLTTAEAVYIKGTYRSIQRLSSKVMCTYLSEVRKILNKFLQREGSGENLNSGFGKRDLEVLLELHQSVPPLPSQMGQVTYRPSCQQCSVFGMVSASCRFYQLTVLCMHPFCASSRCPAPGHSSFAPGMFKQVSGCPFPFAYPHLLFPQA